jgi:uncharacterized protein YndB with AHSA1/START domain
VDVQLREQDLKRPVFTQGEASMSTNTGRLHRILPAAPHKVYRAFLDADALARWLPPASLASSSSWSRTSTCVTPTFSMTPGCQE